MKDQICEKVSYHQYNQRDKQGGESYNTERKATIDKVTIVEVKTTLAQELFCGDCHKTKDCSDKTRIEYFCANKHKLDSKDVKGHCEVEKCS